MDHYKYDEAEQLLVSCKTPLNAHSYYLLMKIAATKGNYQDIMKYFEIARLNR